MMLFVLDGFSPIRVHGPFENALQSPMHSGCPADVLVLSEEELTYNVNQHLTNLVVISHKEKNK